VTSKDGAAAAPPGWLAPLAERVAALSGWRGGAAAALFGVLATAALPPFGLWPLLVPAFTGLLWLLDGPGGPRRAAVLGWAFGFGHFASGLYWVGIAFLVEADRFGAVMPFAVAGLAAGLALFPAAALWLVALPSWGGPARVALLALAWLLVEWLRSWILTGFPWNLVGTTWTVSPAVMQLAAATGVWGLSAMTVLAAGAPAVLARGGRGRVGLAAVLLLLPAVAWAGGALRLAGAPAPGAAVVPDVVLRIVQPSIAQTLKWRDDLRREHVERQLRLSRGPGYRRVTHVVWAETAVPFLLDADPALRARLAEVVPPGGALLAGAPRISESDGERRLWNSLAAIDRDGAVVGTYDKHHLVPFGEYTPLRPLLGLVKLTVGSMDFSAGPGPRTLAGLPGLPPVSPLICYEAIFPGQVVSDVARPAWLLNVTNDAWFGDSTGPYQHFASARLRAVEEGLPLVRAANNGVSAVVDPYGRVLARLDLDAVGVLDAPLPQALPGDGPLYARWRNAIVPLLILMLGTFSLILRRVLS